MNQEELIKYKLQGYCCSQIILAAYLKRTGEENPELIKAMRGLCYGSRIGNLCGTLSGAICTMTLAIDGDIEELCKDLSDWFEDKYGSLQCEEIMMLKTEMCGTLVAETFEQMEGIINANR